MPDYLYLLETRVSPEQRAAIERLQALAQEESLNLYLTGGAVRDLICGAPIRDLDFTVEGNPARIVRELVKGGAELVQENEALRHFELQLAGGVTLSLAGARDERFEYPGAKPDSRWSTIMDDLRRRDFSVNAIGISLNAASRGLVLDPTNGLADLEKREVRILSMHGFTNQPIRLMRILRYSARLGFPMETRTAEWFALALERKVQERFEPAEVGRELLALGREDNPIAVIQSWAKHGFLGAIHPKLGKRPPSLERLTRLLKVRDAFAAQGYRMQLSTPVLHYVLSRLSSRGVAAALSRLKIRSAEISRLTGLADQAAPVIQMLKGRKTKAPPDAYRFLDRVPLELLAFILNETSQAAVVGKIKNFLYKWKPLRQQLPVAELEALGVPRGPGFDRILEQFFELQLAGRARKPLDRVPVLRKLAGIKPEPVKKAKEKESAKAAKKEKTRSAAPEAKKVAEAKPPTEEKLPGKGVAPARGGTPQAPAKKFSKPPARPAHKPVRRGGRSERTKKMKARPSPKKRKKK
jgi:tRNA nucleotidyltransferase/poly(A) polymerase